MLKIPMPILAYLFILCLIFNNLLGINCKAQRSHSIGPIHQTIITFYPQYSEQEKYYWVVLHAHYSSDNYTVAMNQLISDITLIKEFVDQQRHGKIQTKQDHIALIIPNLNINQVINKTSDYIMKLSDIEISLKQTYFIHQYFFIRIIDNKAKLGSFVDKLQNKLQMTINVNIEQVLKDSINNFYTSQSLKIQNVQTPHRQTIRYEQLQQKILNQAKNYCQSIEMKLQQIKSNKELFAEQYFNELQTKQKKQIEQQQIKEMTYQDALDQQLLTESELFTNRIFQVKAKCTGHKPLSMKLSNKKINSQKQIFSKVISGAEVQKEIQKLQKKKIFTK